MPRPRHSSRIHLDRFPCLAAESDFPATADVRYTYAGFKGTSDLPCPHVHKVFEVGLIHKGRATFIIANKHFDFIAGDICIITPSEPHRAFYPVKCICSWLYFDVPRLFAHCTEEPSLTGVGSFGGPGFVNIFRGSDYPGASRIVHEMVEEFSRRDPYSKDALRSLLMSLLVSLHRLAREGDSHFTGTASDATTAFGAIERICPALTFMHENYRDKIDMDELAGRTFMSPSNFRRVFRSCLGCSPHGYLTSYRVDAARVLLEHGGKGVEHVAAECGFADPSSFRRAFRMRVGCSPLVARRRAPIARH